MPDNYLSMAKLQKISAAEQTAYRLRMMARDLILEAEALEATVPRRKRPVSARLVDPRNAQ